MGATTGVMLLVCVALVVTVTLVHYEVVRFMSSHLPRLAMPPRAKLVWVLLGMFTAHATEVALYAAALYGLIHSGWGHFSDPLARGFSTCLYFSAETFSSLGYGDLVPQGSLRLLAGAEALHGLLLIGWSSSYTYVSMERFWPVAETTAGAAIRPPRRPWGLRRIRGGPRPPSRSGSATRASRARG